MSKKLEKKQQAEEEIFLEIDRIYSISDLGLTTALATAGFTLLALDRENPNKVKFVFRREQNIEKVADDFWADRLVQNSRSFWDNLKNLKNRLHSDN